MFAFTRFQLPVLMLVSRAGWFEPLLSLSNNIKILLIKRWDGTAPVSFNIFLSFVSFLCVLPAFLFVLLPVVGLRLFGVGCANKSRCSPTVLFVALFTVTILLLFQFCCWPIMLFLVFCGCICFVTRGCCVLDGCVLDGCVLDGVYAANAVVLIVFVVASVRVVGTVVDNEEVGNAECL